jgi:hypothetical protein
MTLVFIVTAMGTGSLVFASGFPIAVGMQLLFFATQTNIQLAVRLLNCHGNGNILSVLYIFLCT